MFGENAEYYYKSLVQVLKFEVYVEPVREIIYQVRITTSTSPLLLAIILLYYGF